MRKSLCGDLTPVFCPAEPTKNCPRGQPQDNSALHSLAGASPTRPSQLPHLEGQPLRHETVCYSGSFWLWAAKRLVQFFILPPAFPHLLYRKLLVAARASAHLWTLPGSPGGHTARIEGDAVTPSLTSSKNVQVPGDWHIQNRHPAADISTSQDAVSKEDKWGPESLISSEIVLFAKFILPQRVS